MLLILFHLPSGQKMTWNTGQEFIKGGRGRCNIREVGLHLRRPKSTDEGRLRVGCSDFQPPAWKPAIT